ncbi:hypothetical protein L6452_01263 [Arctium lappa]|uniref:Uncharacterized protein n=1 Tax=Arctium lappa TaxID=4217 RepID=A0ACB9FHG1_ARCLA|nr:hypothetical protein L6452_01263 [Arctium lappa]
MFWNTSTIKFDEVRPNSDSVFKITGFLEYSLVERLYTPLQQANNDEGVTIVEPSEVEAEEVEEEDKEEEEEMEGGSPAKTSPVADQRSAQLELARKGKENKKGLSTTGSSVPKRTRMAVPREPSSKGGDALSVATQEKAKVGDAIPEVPISVAPPMQEKYGVERRPPENVQATEASGSNPLTTDEGKGPAEVQTVNFTLSSDFTEDDILDSSRIFPHLGKYNLPVFKEKFKAMTIDNVGSNISGLDFLLRVDTYLFLIFASLSLYEEMERTSQAVPLALNRDKAALERDQVALSREMDAKSQVESLTVRLQEAYNVLETGDQVSLVANEKEIKGMREKEAEQKVKIEELEEKLKAVEAFTRWTTKAAIMRRHLVGNNPLANAAEDLKLYLADIGNEEDLDSEDEDVEVVEVEDKAQVDKAQVGDVSMSQPAEDAPPS